MAFSFSQKPASNAGFSFGATPGLAPAPGPSVGFGTGSLWGAQSSNPAGSSTSNLFGAPTAPAASVVAARPNSGFEDAIMRLARAYPGKFSNGQPNPDCRFKHFFYNMVDPSQKHMYVRPPYIEPSAWEEAERDNPEPADCVPVPVFGFESLHERLRNQQEHAATLKEDVKRLERTTKALQQACFKHTGKLENARRKHAAQTSRFLHLLGSLELLRGSGHRFGPEEVQLMRKLENLKRFMEEPQKNLEEIRSAEMQAVSTHVDMPYDGEDSIEDMAPIARALASQKEGLEHLAKVLKKDKRDVDIIRQFS